MKSRRRVEKVKVRLTGGHKDASLQAGSVDSFQLLRLVIQKHDQETQPCSHSSSARADVTSPVKYF